MVFVYTIFLLLTLLFMITELLLFNSPLLFSTFCFLTYYCLFRISLFRYLWMLSFLIALNTSNDHQSRQATIKKTNTNLNWVFVSLRMLSRWSLSLNENSGPTSQNCSVSKNLSMLASFKRPQQDLHRQTILIFSFIIFAYN